LNRTYCCTEKFNIALSLCGVLEVTFYFSEGFLEAAARRDEDGLEKDDLADKAAGNIFALF